MNSNNFNETERAQQNQFWNASQNQPQQGETFQREEQIIAQKERLEAQLIELRKTLQSERLLIANRNNDPATAEHWKRKAYETELTEHELRLVVIQLNIELSALRLQQISWVSQEERIEHEQRLRDSAGGVAKLSRVLAELQRDYKEYSMIDQNLRIGAEEYRAVKLERQIHAMTHLSERWR